MTRDDLIQKAGNEKKMNCMILKKFKQRNISEEVFRMILLE